VFEEFFFEEGFTGLSRGVVASMIREVVYSSIRMGAYEPIRHILTHNSVDPAHTSPLIKYISALISGAVGSALANPLDLIKTRFQSVLPGEVLPYTNTFSAFGDIVKYHGFRGLYKGWMVTSGRAAVLTSAQLGSYDSIKNNLLIKLFGLKEGFCLHLCASMSAGIITTTAANPFDVIKTRYLSDEGGKYKSVADCAIKTFKSEGVAGFFKGWMPAYWRLGPHTVVSLILIEKIRNLFGLRGL